MEGQVGLDIVAPLKVIATSSPSAAAARKHAGVERVIALLAKVPNRPPGKG